jgi:hypothetical protein
VLSHRPTAAQSGDPAALRSDEACPTGAAGVQGSAAITQPSGLVTAG